MSGGVEVVGSGQNVLIVEDEEEWCGIYQRAVSAQNPDYKVEVAKDLVSAERLIDAAKFAVAFVDVGLDISDDRNVDGLRVMEKIRDTGDETSIVVVTGRSGQDVLPITRDAIKKYGAYDTIGKSTIKPTDIKRLLEGGVEAYRQESLKYASTTGRTGARDVLRGQADGMIWDERVMRITQFKSHAGKFYGFLSELFGEYLPVATVPDEVCANVDDAVGVVYGDYWSRGVGAAIVVCFGADQTFDRAVSVDPVNGRLFGRYLVGPPLRVLNGPGVKGMVLPLCERRREDFAGRTAEA
jgi:ActR/RegA family two-component response regulator